MGRNAKNALFGKGKNRFYYKPFLFFLELKMRPPTHLKTYFITKKVTKEKETKVCANEDNEDETNMQN